MQNQYPANAPLPAPGSALLQHSTRAIYRNPLLLDRKCVSYSYSSSSSSSTFLIVFASSFGAATSPASTPDKPNPNRCRTASSSKPETLALARFRGLPIVPLSNALVGPKSNAVLGNSVGGVVATFDACGGVDPAVGVFDAGDFFIAGVPVLKGSAECCRFS